MANRVGGRDEILKRAKAWLAKGGSPKTNALAKAAGVTSGSFRHHFGSVAEFRRLVGLTALDARETPREVDAEREARERLAREREDVKRRATVTELKRQLAEFESRLAESDARIESLSYLDGRTGEMPEIKASGKVGPLPEATYLALASDWHVGERVRPGEVGHRNEYTPEIASARAEQFFKSNLRMLNAARSAWFIPKMTLWLGGDLCTGLIHEEYKTENYLTPLEEMTLAYDLIERGIVYLLAEGDIEELHVPTSNGNHGRTTQKIHAAGGFRLSYEYALYQQLARRFANEPRVKFQIGQGYYTDQRIYGEIVRWSHGDGVKFAGGVGGVSVPFNRRIGREAQSLGRVLLYPHGHFHMYDPARNRLGNGSLIGWNSYAERYGFDFQAPMQASCVIDSRYKVVSNINPILVEKARK